jgi:hypothetical protein
MRDQGVHLGVDPEKIKVCGLPLRQMFWNVDASDERKMALRYVCVCVCVHIIYIYIYIIWIHTHTHIYIYIL